MRTQPERLIALKGRMTHQGRACDFTREELFDLESAVENLIGDKKFDLNNYRDTSEDAGAISRLESLQAKIDGLLRETSPDHPAVPVTAFIVGCNYRVRSLADSESIYDFTVTGRSTKSVTLMADDGRIFTRRIKVEDSAETVKPFGSYSMAPTLYADRRFE